MKKDQQDIVDKLMNGEYDKYLLGGKAHVFERSTPLKKWWDKFEKEVLEVDVRNDTHIFTTQDKINQAYGNQKNNVI